MSRAGNVAARSLALLSFTAVAIVAIASCREPTKITLDVRTDVPCEHTRGTAIFAGAPGVVERGPANIETSRCDGGRIGTVVLTPASGDAPRVAIKVVAGVDVDVSACTADRQYKGCIVQRRALEYIEHVPLEIPIDLLLVCRDVPCDEESTCSANGRCVSARLDAPRDCAPPLRCFPEDGVDGAADAGESPKTDGSPAVDGAAPNDAGASDAGRFQGVVCGSETCTGTDKCCHQSGPDSRCVPALQQCEGLVIPCDGDEDCPNQACCYSGTIACSVTGTCEPYAHVCHTDDDCPGSKCDRPVLANQYKTCSQP